MALITKRWAGREFTVAFTQHPTGDKAAWKGYQPRDVCVVKVASFTGAMRKHAGWKQERLAPDLATCDRVAHRPVRYTEPTVRIRKAGAK